MNDLPRELVEESGRIMDRWYSNLNPDQQREVDELRAQGDFNIGKVVPLGFPFVELLYLIHKHNRPR